MPLLLPDTILMTADTVGGVWTYTLELSKALQKQGVQVHLATMGRELSSNQRNAAVQLPNLTVHESSFALEWMDNPWKDVDAAGEWLLELEQEIQPDLIHLNNYAHGGLPWQAPVLMTGHSCVLSWWQAVKKEEAPVRWKTYARRVRAGLQGTDHVVGVTGYMLKCLERNYGPFASWGVIHNARDRNGFGSSAKEPIIFSMGRLWDEAKNIQALEVISSDLDWPVCIAGEDHGRLSADSNMSFLGHLNETEVAGWLGKTSIYVMPARYEPFGLSILEAALSGCALVLGDIPSLREVWEDAAIYVCPDEPSVLKQQIRTLIEDPEKREQMARKALDRAGRYSLARFVRNYLKAYQHLLQAEQQSLVQQD